MYVLIIPFPVGGVKDIIIVPFFVCSGGWPTLPKKKISNKIGAYWQMMIREPLMENEKK